MENNLIDSLLHDTSKPLELLLSERFNEHVHFTHLNPTYVVHFLMSLSSMLMSNQVRSKYGVERVFFTHFGQEKIVRLTILTTARGTPSRKTMKVRTFDMSGKQNGQKILLSTGEKKVMRLLLNGEASDLPPDLTKIVEDFYKNERNLEKIDLDQYTADYTVYEVDKEEMYKVDKLDTQTRMKFKFFETLNHQTLREQFDKHFFDVSRFSVPSEFEFSHKENKILLLTDRKVIKPDIQTNFDPNAISSLFSQYYEVSGAEALDKFKTIFADPIGLASLFNSMSFSSGISAECGFTHGSLFLLSYSYPSYIEVKQQIATPIYTPGEDTTIDPSTKMSLVYKPKFTGSEHTLYQIPMVVLFAQHYAAPREVVDEVERSMSITGEVGGLVVELRSKKVKSSLSILQKRLDLVDDLLHLIRRHSGHPEVLAYLLEHKLKKAKPPLRELKFSERNHFSQYLAGWIMSSENKNSLSYKLLGKSDSGSTKFFIRSTKRDETSNEIESKPSNVLLIVKEEKMSNMHFPDTYALDEEYVRYNRLNDEDTVVINIGQEYVHSTKDILTTDNEQDSTRYTVSVSFAKSEEIVDSHAFFALPKVPLSTFHSIPDDLTRVMKQKLTQLFRSGAFFANTGSDHEAFLDGIFLDNECLKGTNKLKNAHSDVYYIRQLSGQILLKMNFRILPNSVTKEELIKIAKSANEELQTSMWKDNGQFFQFVLSENDGIWDVQFLDRERLSMCADVRLRRSRLHECYTNLDVIDTMKKLTKNQDPDQSMITDQIVMVKAYKSLAKILQISNYMMLGFMVRDAISDAVNEHYGSAAIDIGFMLASVYAPTLGEIAKTSGNILLETGSKFSGYALKTLGFGIQRAISIYVFTDLIGNAIAYGKDPNNTDAGIGMVIDGAFATIDLLATAAEAFSAFTFITPMGQIASVVLIVGMNFYQTVKRVEEIEQILPLNMAEVIDESLRAFFHVNTEAYIQKLLSEKAANSILMQQALDCLSAQSRIDTYITGTAELSGNALVMHGDTIINMRSSFYQRVSRASPGIEDSENSKNINMACFLHEEKIEIEHEPNLWEKFTGFFHKIYKAIRVLDRVIMEDHVGFMKVASECDDNCIQRHTPTCSNAFGISKKLTSEDKAALFKLGNGSDLVYGYKEKPNIFLMAGGVKNVTGGSRNDTFVVGIGPITGIVEGLDGVDLLDLSSFQPDKLNIDGDVLEYELGSINSYLLIKNIEIIILPIRGSIKNFMNVSLEGHMWRIVASGKTNIVVRGQSIDHSLILELSGNANVTNYAKNCSISYLIRPNDNNKLKYTSVSILGEQGAKHEIFILQNLWDLENMTYYQDGTLSFLTTNGQRIRLCVSPNILEKTRIIFNDGSVINLNNSLLLSVTLSTDHTIQQIEHMYSDALERLGVLMVAYSISDDESVTISHGKIQESKSSVTSQILHSSVDHSTHMMLNGGQYLILINTNTHGKIEDTTIKSRNAKNLTKVIIDLSGVIEFYTGDESSFIQVHAYLWNRSNLNVEVNLEKSDGLVLLGNIVIQDVLRDDLYSKVSIRNYGELNINLRNRAQNYYRVENAADQYEITMFDGETNILSPSPIKFGNLTDVILLTPYNVEPFNEIIIDSVIQFDSFSINATSLVLTSLGYNYLNNGGKIFTMFLEGFYTVNKMETLSLRLGDQLIQLKEYKRSIAADFSDWWMSTQKMINRG